MVEKAVRNQKIIENRKRLQEEDNIRKRKVRQAGKTITMEKLQNEMKAKGLRISDKDARLVVEFLRGEGRQ